MAFEVGSSLGCYPSPATSCVVAFSDGRHNARRSYPMPTIHTPSEATASPSLVEQGSPFDTAVRLCRNHAFRHRLKLHAASSTPALCGNGVPSEAGYCHGSNNSGRAWASPALP